MKLVISIQNISKHYCFPPMPERALPHKSIMINNNKDSKLWKFLCQREEQEYNSLVTLIKILTECRYMWMKCPKRKSYVEKTIDILYDHDKIEKITSTIHMQPMHKMTKVPLCGVKRLHYSRILHLNLLNFRFKLKMIAKSLGWIQSYFCHTYTWYYIQKSWREPEKLCTS